LDAACGFGHGCDAPVGDFGVEFLEERSRELVFLFVEGFATRYGCFVSFAWAFERAFERAFKRAFKRGFPW